MACTLAGGRSRLKLRDVAENINTFKAAGSVLAGFPQRDSDLLEGESAGVFETNEGI